MSADGLPLQRGGTPRNVIAAWIRSRSATRVFQQVLCWFPICCVCAWLCIDMPFSHNCLAPPRVGSPIRTGAVQGFLVILYAETPLSAGIPISNSADVTAQLADAVKLDEDLVGLLEAGSCGSCLRQEETELGKVVKNHFAMPQHVHSLSVKYVLTCLGGPSAQFPQPWDPMATLTTTMFWTVMFAPFLNGSNAP